MILPHTSTNSRRRKEQEDDRNLNMQQLLHQYLLEQDITRSSNNWLCFKETRTSKNAHLNSNEKNAYLNSNEQKFQI